MFSECMNYYYQHLSSDLIFILDSQEWDTIELMALLTKMKESRAPIARYSSSTNQERSLEARPAACSNDSFLEIPGLREFI